jgi:hypothetical protein
LKASASSAVGTGAGAGLVGADLCGGGVGALPFVAPLTPFPEGTSGGRGTAGGTGDDGAPLGRSWSMSISIGVGSLMLGFDRADKADKRRSCSGGRLSGWELGS